MFSSTMHGNAHEKSDIDAFIFIDPDAVEEQLGGDTLDSHDYSEMTRVVEHDLLSRLRIVSGEQSSGRRNDVQMFLINDEIIDGSIKKI